MKYIQLLITVCATPILILIMIIIVSIKININKIATTYNIRTLFLHMTFVCMLSKRSHLTYGIKL